MDWGHGLRNRENFRAVWMSWSEHLTIFILDPLTATYGALARGTALWGLLARPKQPTLLWHVAVWQRSRDGRTLWPKHCWELAEASRRFGNVSRCLQSTKEARKLLRTGGTLTSVARADMLEAFVFLDKGELGEAEPLFLALGEDESQTLAIAARVQLGLLLVQRELGHVERVAEELGRLFEAVSDEDLSLRLEVAYHLAKAYRDSGQLRKAMEAIRIAEGWFARAVSLACGSWWRCFELESIWIAVTWMEPLRGYVVRVDSRMPRQLCALISGASAAVYDFFRGSTGRTGGPSTGF